MFLVLFMIHVSDYYLVFAHHRNVASMRLQVSGNILQRILNGRHFTLNIISCIVYRQSGLSFQSSWTLSNQTSACHTYRQGLRCKKTISWHHSIGSSARKTVIMLTVLDSQNILSRSPDIVIKTRE